MSLTNLSIILLTLLASSQLFAGETLRIVSQNMNRFFDNIDDGNNEKVVSSYKFNQKVSLTSTRIVEQFRLPDIVALQEIENRNVLNHIVAAVAAETGIEYQVIILDGNDISGINIAFLVKPGRKVKSARQLFKHERLSYDGSRLFSRPPLYLQVCEDSECLFLLNLHLRSMRGIRLSSSAERVKQKRLEQASAIANWVEDFQQSNRQASLTRVKKPAKDLVSDDLTDLTRQIPSQYRYSYIYKGNKQILDYMFVNSGFKHRLENIGFTRIEYRFSDHAGLIADFIW